MIRTRIWSLGLAALLAFGLAQAGDATKPTCSAHGTAVDFFDTPAEAVEQAQKEKKLVLMLHVSGHFEDPRFT